MSSSRSSRAAAREERMRAAEPVEKRRKRGPKGRIKEIAEEEQNKRKAEDSPPHPRTSTTTTTTATSHHAPQKEEEEEGGGYGVDSKKRSRSKKGRFEDNTVEEKPEETMTETNEDSPALSTKPKIGKKRDASRKPAKKRVAEVVVKGLSETPVREDVVEVTVMLEEETVIQEKKQDQVTSTDEPKQDVPVPVPVPMPVPPEKPKDESRTIPFPRNGPPRKKTKTNNLFISPFTKEAVEFARFGRWSQISNGESTSDTSKQDDIDVYLHVGDSISYNPTTRGDVDGDEKEVVILDFVRGKIQVGPTDTVALEELKGATKIRLVEGGNKEKVPFPSPCHVWVKRHPLRTAALLCDQDKDSSAIAIIDDSTEDQEYRLLKHLPDTKMLMLRVPEPDFKNSSSKEMWVPSDCPMCGEKLGKPFKACLNQSYEKTARVVKHCQDKGHEYPWTLSTSLPEDCKGDSITLRGYIQRLMNEAAKFCDPVPSMHPDQLPFRIAIAKIMSHASTLNGTNRFLDVYGGKKDRNYFKELASQLLAEIEHSITYFDYKVWIDGAPMLKPIPADKVYNAINLFFRQGLFWDQPHPALVHLIIPEGLQLDKRGSSKTGSVKVPKMAEV